MDWDSVTVIRQKQERAKVARSSAEVNAARRAGAVVATEKKTVANKGHVGADHALIAKLDRTDDIVVQPKLSLDVGKAIQKARQEKGLTQKDLGQKVNEKANVMNDYEMGRAVPNQQILAKLERALGVKLRGKNIGEPLTFGKKK
ncbi:multi protein-bridging factor 1 [Basidiobolus meristosporus CBS 931.73]|uniref:Multi protein-bridging factor 1 n=1 Tax=Basidiobolus meristosporus CBS 931.73 TaxID=1314790 RepID=A0A1Y1Y2D0_9FUNG|nr:multi protein-bridging factor 1 [Basidiobolus meristosporus CBS 931.73]|eukprot:ORX92129.1 multi protein-bridging factor 1 [Basidiobolus meristosporus CBS 931.73]